MCVNTNHSIVEYSVTGQDPILGIKPANIVEKLSCDNWQSKALLCRFEQATHYIHLNQAVSLNRRNRSYCVNAYDIHRRVVVSQAYFSELNGALNFANRAGLGLSMVNQGECYESAG